MSIIEYKDVTFFLTWHYVSAFCLLVYEKFRSFLSSMHLYDIVVKCDLVVHVLDKSCL